MFSGHRKLHPTVKPSASDSGMVSDDTHGVADEENLWWRQLHHENSADAREKLAALYLPYTRTVAAAYYAKRTHDDIEFAEYFQFASVGLVDAMERFDPGFGTQFKTFAARRMHGAILNGLERLTEKNQQIAVRRKLREERLQVLKADLPTDDDVASELSDTEGDPAFARARRPSVRSQQELFRYLADVGIGLALGILLEGTGMYDTEPDVENAVSPEIRYFQQTEIEQLRRRLQTLVADLPKQEQSVIRYHYLQETDFDEIAVTMGVTRSRVSQIHRKALTRLREMLARSPDFDVAW